MAIFDHLTLTITILTLALVSSLGCATEPDPLQDFCVASKENLADHEGKQVYVNGRFCKDPKHVSSRDFFFSGLNIPGNTSNLVGSTVTPVTVDQLPGLNTLGISLARIDYAPKGLNPPHMHPRATEILVVLKGELHVGFVTSNSRNHLFKKFLRSGDVFVFPMGLVHFQYNVGDTEAVAIASLNSQNPGVISIANAVFGSTPPINPTVLEKAFQVDKKVVKKLESQFWHTSRHKGLYNCSIGEGDRYYNCRKDKPNDNIDKEILV